VFPHEIDVLIKKAMRWKWLNVNFILLEKISLTSKYVFLRFNDLKKKADVIFSKNETISKCWIVTNNRFTSDAVDAKCSG
jgi:hypothetical protein